MARRRRDHGHGEAEAPRRALSAAGWRSGRSAAAPRRRPGLPPCSPALLAAARGSAPQLYSRRARRGRREGSAGIPPPSSWRGSPAMRRRARIRPAVALRAQGRRGGGGTRPRPPWHGAGEAGPPLRVAGEEGRRAAPSSAAVEGGAMAGAQGRAPAGRRRASEEGAPPAAPSGAALPHRPDLSSSAPPCVRPALLTAAAALCARSPWPRRLASSPSRPEQQQEGGATGEVRSPTPPRSARSLHGTAAPRSKGRRRAPWADRARAQRRLAGSGRTGLPWPPAEAALPRRPAPAEVERRGRESGEGGRGVKKGKKNYDTWAPRSSSWYRE